MDIENVIWKDLPGVYNIPYDVSIPLNTLRGTDNPEIVQSVFHELWDDLHHQGDIGIASYYVVPKLIEICIDKQSLDWNYIGLCVLIEHCRYSKTNPVLPKEIEDYYFGPLHKLEDYLLVNFKRIIEKTALQLTLAFFSTMKRQRELGIVIAKLDESIIAELIEKYG